MLKHLEMISTLIQELSGQLQKPGTINTSTRLYSHRTISREDSRLQSNCLVDGTTNRTIRESCVQI